MRRTIPDALSGVSRLGIDTAPLIAYVQAEAVTLPVCDIVFNAVKAGSLFMSVSAIALTECLVHPLKMNDTIAAKAYDDLFRGRNVTCLPVSRRIARRAAERRVMEIPVLILSDLDP